MPEHLDIVIIMPHHDLLHTLSDILGADSFGSSPEDDIPTYWYEGRSVQGDRLKLPRSMFVEAIARGLMQQLATHTPPSHEGKMYGVLLVNTPVGARVLKAFSGLLQGSQQGWVPPIPGRDRVAVEEAHTLAQLAAMKQELIELQHLPVRQQYQQLSEESEMRLLTLTLCHRQRKQERQQQRQDLIKALSGEALELALRSLDNQSRWDGSDRRRLKQAWEARLQPLKHQLEQADTQMRQLKQQRKTLSRQLQFQMHAAYCLTNFVGESLPLQQLIPGAMPTGTGDCCAPKLLHYAATHNLQPVAMAEFWWGPSPAKGDKIQGQFYGACAERCQPLMGFLLSGLPQSEPLVASNAIDPSSILYEDEWLIAVDKPAGLLSVPGRYRDRQDSVLSRLRLHPNHSLSAVHRLDQDTSGILLLARDPQSDRQLRQQFQQRQVHKVYEAVLAGAIKAEQGVIDLPLWPDPDDLPRQTVNWQRGKSSQTHFRVITRMGDFTRIEFIPVTGRTHQLRVHAADVNGLGVPIWGDRLYGCWAGGDRLHLHARELRFLHPYSQQPIHLQANTPF